MFLNARYLHIHVDNSDPFSHSSRLEGEEREGNQRIYMTLVIIHIRMAALAQLLDQMHQDAGPAKLCGSPPDSFRVCDLSFHVLSITSSSLWILWRLRWLHSIPCSVCPHLLGRTVAQATIECSRKALSH